MEGIISKPGEGFKENLTIDATICGQIGEKDIRNVIDAITHLPGNKNYIARCILMNGHMRLLFEERRIHINIELIYGGTQDTLLYPFSIIFKRGRLILRDSTGCEVHMGIDTSITESFIKTCINESMRRNNVDIVSYGLNGDIVCPEDPNIVGFYYSHNSKLYSLNYLEDGALLNLMKEVSV